jgi:hypothetical protein
MDTVSEYLRTKYEDTWTSFFKTPVRSNANLAEFRPSSVMGSSSYIPGGGADAAPASPPAADEHAYVPTVKKAAATPSKR